MDEGNSAAESGIQGGISYVENSLGSVTTVHWLVFEDISGYRKPFLATEKCIIFLLFSYIEKFFNTVCENLDEMIDAGTPPDLVLDLTYGGITSEVVKSLSLTLGLPTVTSTIGEVGDIS